MRVSRFFIDGPLSQGKYIDLPPHLINYIVNVLRLKTGNNIILFNGQQVTDTSTQKQHIGEFNAVLSEISKRKATVFIENFVVKNTESSLNMHLFQGISRSERMDFTIQKAIELGVTQITPLLTQRSNSGKFNAKRLGKKMQHWQGIAISACEQSGRTTLVTINEPLHIDQIEPFSAKINLLLSPDASSSLSELDKEIPASVNIIIGPEGGLNEDEIEWAGHHGYQKLSLGKRILRTETAGLAVLSVLQFLWGDLS